MRRAKQQECTILQQNLRGSNAAKNYYGSATIQLELVKMSLPALAVRKSIKLPPVPFRHKKNGLDQDCIVFRAGSACLINTPAGQTH